MNLGMIDRQDLNSNEDKHKLPAVLKLYNPTAYGERLRVCVANPYMLFGYRNYTENLFVTESFNADSLQNGEILKFKVPVKYY
jgi:hypothetical protein